MLSVIRSALRAFAGTRRLPARRTVLGLEPLEAREVPASYTVTMMSDSATPPMGQTTLRSALNAANARPATESSTITFGSMLSGTITLGSALPTFQRDITITGPGATTITVQRDPLAATNFRIFTISISTLTCSISGLTLMQGVSSAGGGIINSGTLALSGVYVNSNIASGAVGLGGGIYNEGTLTMTGSCQVESNQARRGGGIYNTNTATIYSSTIAYNYASDAGGGIYNTSSDAILTLTTCTLNTNKAINYGGGIWNNGTLQMSYGAIIYDYGDPTIANLKGGGLYQDGGTVTLGSVDIEHNNADQGGGFYVNSGSLALNGCTLSNNVANTGNGGVVDSSNGATLTISGGTITDTIVYIV